MKSWTKVTGNIPEKKRSKIGEVSSTKTNASQHI